MQKPSHHIIHSSWGNITQLALVKPCSRPETFQAAQPIKEALLGRMKLKLPLRRCLGHTFVHHERHLAVCVLPSRDHQVDAPYTQGDVHYKDDDQHLSYLFVRALLWLTISASHKDLPLKSLSDRKAKSLSRYPQLQSLSSDSFKLRGLSKL